MNKTVLLLSGSPRLGANSELLGEQFLQGAKEAGNHVEKIALRNQEINYCLGCDACKQNIGVCFQTDDMEEILEKMVAADVLVLATPVYFYSMAAQMKTLIDRVYARYLELENKAMYFLITGAADHKKYFENTLAGLRSFAACLPQAREEGVIYGLGVSEAGEVKTTYAMQEAYEMGKAI
nr:flavodoxin family protein [uncultured Anaeromusa sp.]